MTSFSPEQEILFLLLKMFYSLFTDFIKISSILASSFLNDKISCLELIKFNTSRTFESAGMSILNRFSLFETTLNKELLGSEELLDQLTKNGLAFEEFVLGVVGSGSQAGKLLNQLSQINRFKPN